MVVYKTLHYQKKHICKDLKTETMHVPNYSRVQKSIENFAFRPKMTIFRRAGMREGGLPLPLGFQYWIFFDIKTL